jgi:hypothetical protein
LGCLFWLFSTTASSENLGTTLLGHAAIDRDVSAIAGSDEASTSPLPGETSLVHEEESLDFQPQRLRLWGWLPFGPCRTAQGLNINRLRLRCLSLPLEACLGPVTTSLLAGLL